MSESVTLRDVAKAAGVGLSTASRALNADPRCAPATRERVEIAARKLGYAPDPGVSALARRRSGRRDRYAVTWLREGLVKREGSDGYDGRLVAATREQGRRLGYEISVVGMEAHGGPARCARVLRERGVKGLFLSSLKERALLEAIDWSPFSVVAFTQESFRVPFDLVRENIFRSFYDAWERVRAAGHSRVGVVLPSAIYPRQNQLILGACAQHAAELADRIPPLILKPQANDSTSHYGHETVAWFEQYRPTAVISKNEGAWWPICDAGYRCPEDFSYVSTNLEQGTRRTSGFDPQVDALAFNLISQMDSLIRQGIRGARSVPVTRMVDSVWEDRGTLASLAPHATA